MSPILFNLAIERLLHSIQNNGSFQGYKFTTSDQAPASLLTLLLIKTLTYADDILIFLHNMADLDVLFRHLHMYQKASDAKFNKDSHRQTRTSLYRNMVFQTVMIETIQMH